MVDTPDTDPLESVRAMIRAYVDTGDPGQILSEGALELIDLVWEINDSSSGDGAAPADVVYLVAMLHWCRFLELPDRAGYEDLEYATELFAVLITLDEHLVPEPLRMIIPSEAVVRAGRDPWAEKAYFMIKIAQRQYSAIVVSLAVSFLRQAVHRLPADDQHRGAMLSNLGVALRLRFDHRAELADLDEAIQVTREAVSCRASEDDRLAIAVNCSSALLERFERTGRIGDLDEAVDVARDTIAAHAPSGDRGPLPLRNLGNALLSRYTHASEIRDLNDAIRLLRAASDRLPEDDPQWGDAVSSLSRGLWIRFDRERSVTDLTSAIQGWRAALAHIPAGSDRRAAMRSNLGGALQALFRTTGAQVHLDEAIDHCQAAVDATPAGRQVPPAYLTNLANALRTRYEYFGAPSDLDRALDIAEEAVAFTSPTDPDLAGRLYNLGLARSNRYARLGDRADLDQATQVWRRASQVKEGPAVVRSIAARQWATGAASLQQWTSALDGYAQVIDLLSLLAWHGTSAPSREQSLRYWTDLGPEAASCAIAAGRPDDTITLLEQSRGVIWSHLLDRRTDLTALRSASPGVADQLEIIRRELDLAVDHERPIATVENVPAAA